MNRRPPSVPMPAVGLDTFAAPFSAPQKQTLNRQRNQAFGSFVQGSSISQSAPPISEQLGQHLQPVYDMHHYAWVRGSTPYVLAAANVSYKFLEAQDALRNILGLRNPATAGNLYIEFGNQASVSSWLQLAPGQYVLFDMVVPQDDLYVMSDAGTALTLSYVYSTFTP